MFSLLHQKFSVRLIWLRCALVVAATLTTGQCEPSSQAMPLTTAGPTKAEIRRTADRYELLVNSQPFFIKGAGLGAGNMEKLAAHGGNSIRTWRTGNARESGQALLDRAHRLGLYVTLGLEVGRERHGFDYDDQVAVARQLEKIKNEVLQYRNHPAVIIWAIGNELNLNNTNLRVWDAVNDISKMIHQVDPNHLTTTPLAGISPDLVREIKSRAPDLDLLSVQIYADIMNLPARLREAGWDGPYLLTEWGATGHWEVSQTEWGAPLENDSTSKARLYQKRYETIIAADQTQCLGSYAFLWGQKQERTPTWYGVFLQSGETTEAVDVLQYLWRGDWPANRSPQIRGAWLDGKTAGENVRLQSGRTYAARISSSDPDDDPLTYSWEVLEESAAKTAGGDFEAKPALLSGLIQDVKTNGVILTAPDRPGAYRLFAYAHDGRGNAAHVNIPFWVNRPDAAGANGPAPVPSAAAYK